MTVPNTDYQTLATGDGATTAFDFTWRLTDESQVTVFVDDVQQIAGQDFVLNTRVLIDGLGGTVTFAAAPAVASVVRIQRQDDFLQPSNLLNNRTLSPKTLMDMIDKLAIGLQQVNNAVSVIPVVLTPPDPPLAGALIGWNSAATDTVNVDPGTAGQVLTSNGPGVPPSMQAGGGGTGNVSGPGSATDGHLAVFSGATGKLIRDGGAPPTSTSDVQVMSGTLTATQIKALKAGILTITPPGAGKEVIITHADFKFKYGTVPFKGSGSCILEYTNKTSIAAVFSNLTLIGKSNRYTSTDDFLRSNQLGGVENLGVRFRNPATVDFVAGDSTLQYSIQYRVVTWA